MSAVYALLTTLQQLLEQQRASRAEDFLDRCTRPLLLQCVAEAERMDQYRVVSMLKTRLRRRKPLLSVDPAIPWQAWLPVFNRWCAEGARFAIRMVLGELSDAELTELAQLPGLDAEVVSMTRQFRHEVADDTPFYDVLEP